MKLYQLLILPVAAMAIVSCSSITTESSTSANITQGVPGGELVETTQLNATVSAINLKQHKATLQFADGTTKEFDVRKDVDLTQRKVGEKVVIRTTETIATKIEKP